MRRDASRHAPMIEIVAAIGGVILIATALLDAFETIVLPRRVTRQVRLARIFFRSTWKPWAALAPRMPGVSRETYLRLLRPARPDSPDRGLGSAADHRLRPGRLGAGVGYRPIGRRCGTRQPALPKRDDVLHSWPWRRQAGVVGLAGDRGDRGRRWLRLSGARHHISAGAVPAVLHVAR